MNQPVNRAHRAVHASAHAVARIATLLAIAMAPWATIASGFLGSQ